MSPSSVPSLQYKNMKEDDWKALGSGQSIAGGWTRNSGRIAPLATRSFLRVITVWRRVPLIGRWVQTRLMLVRVRVVVVLLLLPLVLLLVVVLVLQLVLVQRVL